MDWFITDRMPAYTCKPPPHCLIGPVPRFPGQYDENTFRGLDWSIAEAAKRGLRLLLTLANYWEHFGGVDQYNRWSYVAGHGSCPGARFA